VTAQGSSKGAFIGIGAGLTLIILLVLQSLTGSGLLSTRVVTTTTTAAVSTVPDAYQQVASAYKKKYKMDPRSMNEPIFIVRPRTVFGFIEKSFPKSATRWRL